MLINTTEKLWYEAIDGSRRIEEIIQEKISSSQKSTYLDMARTFFERLWWYDQVVFDASGQQCMPSTTAAESIRKLNNETRTR